MILFHLSVVCQSNFKRFISYFPCLLFHLLVIYQSNSEWFISYFPWSCLTIQSFISQIRNSSSSVINVWSCFTLQSFISQIPNGLFGTEGEMRLLAVMEIKDLTEQFESISQVSYCTILEKIKVQDVLSYHSFDIFDLI